MIGYGTNIVRDGLVLYLDAANPKSYPGTGTTWYDLSGDGNHGTLVNGTAYNSNNMGTMSFDGVNDSSDFGNILQLNLSSRTYCCWYKSNIISSSVNYFLITKTDNGSTAYRQALGFNTNGDLYVILRGAANSNYDMTATNHKKDTNWHYIVWAIDRNSNQYLYQDNILLSTSNISPINTNNFILNRPLRIGSYNSTSNSPILFFNGNIANVQVYDRSLSAQEVSQNFNAIKSRYGL